MRWFLTIDRPLRITSAGSNHAGYSSQHVEQHSVDRMEHASGELVAVAGCHHPACWQVQRNDADLARGNPHWRGWLKPESRCLVPFNSFAEYAPEPHCKAR